MKAISGETMRDLDRRTIEEFGVSGLTLMENAGKGCTDTIISRYGESAERNALIFAGKGNNGGDGFVIARLLDGNGWRVRTIVLAQPDEIKGEAKTNLDLIGKASLTFISTQEELESLQPELGKATAIIDALFGTGLKSEVRDLYAAAVALINSAGRPVVSVDIPSGIDSSTGRVLGCAVMADMTVTFALAKLGHIFYPGAEFTGELKVVDIGIPNELADNAQGCEFFDAAAARPLLRKRSRTAHKGHGGHSLIIAGSIGKSGAAVMAAYGVVRAGGGLVTLALPASLNAALEAKTIEVMTVPLPEEETGFMGYRAKGPIEAALPGKVVAAIGPGLSWRPETARLVRELTASVELPMVIDADGLNAISEEPGILFGKKSATIIMTPHPGEMSRLTGLSIPEIEGDRIGAARAFALKYGVWLILKGARTVIAAPDGRIAVNGSGNPGMATGGMGDVLTGVLTALIAQGYDPWTSCRLGVFIHGLAADLVAAEKGEIGMSAVDVQEKLPYAFKHLMS